MSNVSWNQRRKNYTESDGPIWRLGSRMKYQVLKLFGVMYLFKNFKFYVVNLPVEIRFLVEIKLHILRLRNKVFHSFDNFILYFLTLVMVFVSIRIREKFFSTFNSYWFKLLFSEADCNGNIVIWYQKLTSIIQEVFTPVS